VLLRNDTTDRKAKKAGSSFGDFFKMTRRDFGANRSQERLLARTDLTECGGWPRPVAPRAGKPGKPLAKGTLTDADSARIDMIALH